MLPIEKMKHIISNNNKKASLLWANSRHKEALELINQTEDISISLGMYYTTLLKGMVLYALGNYKKAISAFEYAWANDERLKEEGSCLTAGLAYVELEEYEIAIKYFEGAIKLSSNEFVDKIFNNLGLCKHYLSEFERAVKVYNNGIELKPTSSLYYNKGNSLLQLNMFQEAVKSFEIAEKMGHNELACYGQGIALRKLNKNNDAIIAFEKVVQNAKNYWSAFSHLNMSEIYNSSDYDSSKKHAFIALEEQNRDYTIIAWIKTKFSSDLSNSIYTNRCKYLDYLLRINVEKNDSEKTLIRTHKILMKNVDFTSEIDQYYCFLLINKEISLPLNLSFEDRLRLAYLISYKNNRAWETFFIIDEILDNECELTPMDYYFYLLSAYLIGEPKEELIWLSNRSLNHCRDSSDSFEYLYNDLSTKVKSKIQNNEVIDPYLINLSDDEIPILENVEKLTHLNDSVQKALISIYTNCHYQIPFTKNEINGLLSQELILILRQFSSNVENNPLWNNVIRCLDADLHNSQDIVYNLREYVKQSNDEEFSFLLFTLVNLYIVNDSLEDKRVISILIAASYLSYFFEYKKISRVTEKVIDTAVDFVFAQIRSFIANGIFGLSWAIGFLIKLFLGKKKINNQKEIDEQFENLIAEINNI